MPAPLNPKGAKSDKIWRDAIMRAVRRLNGDPVQSDGPDKQRLERLADSLVAKGIDGDTSALREIGDRLDGKAHQTTEVTHIRQRASDLSDDELAGHITLGSSEGTAETPSDQKIIN